MSKMCILRASGLRLRYRFSHSSCTTHPPKIGNDPQSEKLGTDPYALGPTPVYEAQEHMFEKRMNNSDFAEKHEGNGLTVIIIMCRYVVLVAYCCPSFLCYYSYHLYGKQR